MDNNEKKHHNSLGIHGGKGKKKKSTGSPGTKRKSPRRKSPKRK